MKTYPINREWGNRKRIVISINKLTPLAQARFLEADEKGWIDMVDRVVDDLNKKYGEDPPLAIEEILKAVNGIRADLTMFAKAVKEAP